MGGYAVIQGKSITKSDKELVEAILGGEMKNAWQKGDGKDQRGDAGPYSKTRKGVSRRQTYQEGYDAIAWKR